MDTAEQEDINMESRHQDGNIPCTRSVSPQGPNVAVPQVHMNTPSQSSTHAVIIQSTEGNNIFTNPVINSRLLSESVFHKKVIDSSVKVLGRGQAIRFEIPSLDDLNLSLTDITTLGGHKVRCFVPRSGGQDLHIINYGKIHPVSPDLTEKEILENLGLLDHTSSKILAVTRLKAKSEGGEQVNTMTVRIKFKGPLPSRVCINQHSYPILPFTHSVLRCFTCWRFGHGQLTCRSKVRCSNCSGFHSAKNCTNSPSCYFCNGTHKITSKKCPVFKQALEIQVSHQGQPSGFQSALNEALRKLNPSRTTPLPAQPTLPVPVQPQTSASVRPRNQNIPLPSLSTRNSFALLSDEADRPHNPVPTYSQALVSKPSSSTPTPPRTTSKRRRASNSSIQDDWPTDFQVDEARNTQEDIPQANVFPPSSLGTSVPPNVPQGPPSSNAPTRPPIPIKSKDWTSQELFAIFTPTLFKFLNTYSTEQSFSTAFFHIIPDLLGLLQHFLPS